MKPAALQRTGREDPLQPTTPVHDDAASGVRKGRRHARTRRIDVLIVLLISAVAAWTAWSGVQFIRADFASLKARHRIDNWQAGRTRWTYPDWLQAREDLRAAIAITPDNATLHEYMGMLHVLAGLGAWSIAPARVQLYTEARQHQQRVLELRPTHGLAWIHLARSEYALEACTEAQWQAWRKALHFSPYEPVVQGMLADLALACHPRAPEDVKAWLAAHHAQANARARREVGEAALRYGVDSFKPPPSPAPAGK